MNFISGMKCGKCFDNNSISIWMQFFLQDRTFAWKQISVKIKKLIRNFHIQLNSPQFLVCARFYPLIFPIFRRTVFIFKKSDWVSDWYLRSYFTHMNGKNTMKELCGRDTYTIRRIVSKLTNNKNIPKSAFQYSNKIILLQSKISIVLGDCLLTKRYKMQMM